MDLRESRPDRKLLLGVVHLPPLPGSARFAGLRDPVRAAARRDASLYLEGGMDGFIVENFGDAPFHKSRVEAAVVAEMAVITKELVELAGDDRLVGVNVLRNDAQAALAVASAAGARFIRINVHQGIMFCDQGAIEGDAEHTLRDRRRLEVDVKILADVAVKHATPPPGFQLGEAARDLAYRGLADGLIVTGAATGARVSLNDLDAVRRAVPDRILCAGSGVDRENIAKVLARADGVIVGTSLKRDHDVQREVVLAQVKTLVKAARG